jgi:hypothetical protein
MNFQIISVSTLSAPALRDLDVRWARNRRCGGRAGRRVAWYAPAPRRARRRRLRAAARAGRRVAWFAPAPRRARLRRLRAAARPRGPARERQYMQGQTLGSSRLAIPVSTAPQAGRPSVSWANVDRGERCRRPSRPAVGEERPRPALPSALATRHPAGSAAAARRRGDATVAATDRTAAGAVPGATSFLQKRRTFSRPSAQHPLSSNFEPESHRTSLTSTCAHAR